VTLFDDAQIVGTFLGFSEGGLEFHADLILPYRNEFQSVPMHGQFVLVALENDDEAVLGRITTISAQGRLVSGAGEDYAIRQQRENRPVPEDLRDQFLKYRVDIRILGVIRRRADDKEPVFVASHRRLPHVGAKVAFLGDDLLRQVSGATVKGPNAVEIGFLAFGEFVHAGQDNRVGDDERLQIQDPLVLPRFDISQMVSRRSFVFARAGFGKSNLVKLLFSNLYGGDSVPVVQQRDGTTTAVGTVIFDPDGEYYWPDVKGRPGLCDVPALQDRLAVFTYREAPSDFYKSFVVDKVKLDIRELDASKVISLVLPPERQDNQNVIKLKSLRKPEWEKLVNAVHADKGGTDLAVFYEILQLKEGFQDGEALAAKSNMTRVVNTLHDPSSQLLSGLLRALGEGKLCVVDISQMRGSQGLALAGVLLQRIFEHNAEEFTKREPRSIPTIAVIEEAQSVLGPTAGQGEGPFVTWVKEGRKYDLGSVLITQQPGSIPHEILSQGDNWFVFHLLSDGDLRAVKKANAHFSEDVLSSLLNEPIPGHGVFWSSSGDQPYTIPIRALLFEEAYKPLDPQYNRPSLDCYAAGLGSQLAEALAAAADAAGGNPVIVAGITDASETFKVSAIQQLAKDQEFQQRVRSSNGMAWGHVLSRLAEFLPDTLGQSPEQKKDWVYNQHLVKRALTDILGPEGQGWRTESRPSAQGRPAKWILATAQAKTTLPEAPAAWVPDEGYEPPENDALF
jgi:hypothetical protein